LASPKQSILDNIVTTLQGITTGNGYYTTIQQVIKGKIVSVTKIPPAWRAAYCCAVFANQTNARTGTDISQAEAEFSIYCAMDNVTSLNFMNFLDDIEASLAKSPVRNDVAGLAFNVLDSYVVNVTTFDTEEIDEMLSSGDEQYRVREAILTFSVSYTYNAIGLSGN